MASQLRRLRHGQSIQRQPGTNHSIVVNNPKVVKQLILDFIGGGVFFDRPARKRMARGVSQQPINSEQRFSVA